MSSATNDLSVVELEQLLNSRRTQLHALRKQRDKLRREIIRLDRQIEKLLGDRNGNTATGRRSKQTKTKNVRSLREYVLEILGKSKKGFTLAELAQKVLKSGYKSNSANFRNVLYQCVGNTKGLYHDHTTGTYRMKSVVARETKDQVADPN